jgi:hypothetical protein
MKIRTVEAELFHTDVSKQAVTFHSFANITNKNESIKTVL